MVLVIEVKKTNFQDLCQNVFILTKAGFSWSRDWKAMSLFWCSCHGESNFLEILKKN